VWSEIVIEENEGTDKRVSVDKAIEAAFGIIPRFKGFVKAFDKVVRDVGGEVFDLDMSGVREVGLNSDIVSVPIIGDDGAWRAERFDLRHDGMS